MTVIAKVYLSTLLSLVFGMYSFQSECIGQSILLDSIVDELDIIQSDSAKIAWALVQSRKSDLELAAVYVDKGIELARKNKDLKSLAELYTEEAIIHNRQGRLNQGLISFFLMDSISRMLQDSLKIAAAQTNIGLTYFYLGNLDQALFHYSNAYQLHQSLDDPKSYSRLLNNLAIANKKANNFELAKDFYNESLQTKMGLKDSLGIATTLMNIGLLQAELKNYQSAIDTLGLASAIYLEQNEIQDAMSSQLSLGKVLIDYGQLDNAYPIILKSYNYFKANYPESRDRLNAAGDLANLSAQRKEWEAADQYADEAIQMARRSDKLDDLQNMLLLKSRVDAARNNYQAGYHALWESYTLKDSLNAFDRVTLIEELQTKFEVDVKQKEIELLNTKSDLDEIKIETARTRNIWLLCIGIGLVLFSGFLYRLYRQIKDQKKMISQALKDKESLLKEIHHRVKNNLQVISSLLNMQSLQLEDENAQAAVRESRNRVKSMALIHQDLYKDTNLSQIDSASYFEDLTQSLFDSYNIDPDRIVLEKRIDSVLLDVDIIIPLGLILNELISNALKYAFPNNKGGTLSVRFLKTNDQFTLEVNDNGIGLPNDFDKEKLKSMGYQLIHDFARKLKGNLQISSKKGTTVTLSIPQSKLAS